MKNPTAIELWNFLMIMVPPILRATNMTADQKEAKTSENDLAPAMAQHINARIPVIARMEYLQQGRKESD